MSYTIYFQAYEKGEDQQLDAERIVECFEPFVTHKDESSFRVEYDDLNSSYIFINLDNEPCSGFAVHRPCGDSKFYKALFKVTELGNLICLFPEGNAQIFNHHTIEHLPDDLKLEFDDGRMTYEIITTFEEYLRKINILN